jgi:hypothetical protein
VLRWSAGSSGEVLHKPYSCVDNGNSRRRAHHWPIGRRGGGIDYASLHCAVAFRVPLTELDIIMAKIG